jgi:hypothetical protein
MTLRRQRLRSLLFCISALSKVAEASSSSTLPPPSHCWLKYSDALPGIYDDLAKWSTDGVTAAHVDDMRKLLVRPGTSLAHDGAVFHIIDNAVYGEPLQNWTHLPTSMYASALNALLRNYSLPDATLFITVSDHTDQILGLPYATGQERALPVFRSCKTADAADVLLPSYAILEHRSWRFDLLNQTMFNLPWAAREDIVYTAYLEAIATATDGRFTTRYNERGEPDHKIREALTRFANTSDPNSWHGVRPMINTLHSDLREWGRYKYIAHVAGTTCSNKLEKALPLGSVMILEEGGYISAAHRMMRPWVSYVPFYRFMPQELRDVVNLLAAKPALGAAIAAESTRIARDYFSLDGLGCQLMMTVTEYARMQRFKPRDLVKPMGLLPYEDWMLQTFTREFGHSLEKLHVYERWLLEPGYNGPYGAHAG